MTTHSPYYAPPIDKPGPVYQGYGPPPYPPPGPSFPQPQQHPPQQQPYYQTQQPHFQPQPQYQPGPQLVYVQHPQPEGPQSSGGGGSCCLPCAFLAGCAAAILLCPCGVCC